MYYANFIKQNLTHNSIFQNSKENSLGKIPMCSSLKSWKKRIHIVLEEHTLNMKIKVVCQLCWQPVKCIVHDLPCEHLKITAKLDTRERIVDKERETNTICHITKGCAFLSSYKTFFKSFTVTCIKTSKQLCKTISYTVHLMVYCADVKNAILKLTLIQLRFWLS